MTQFENVSCSQCGRSFGPSTSGYSHCSQHTVSDAVVSRRMNAAKKLSLQIKAAKTRGAANLAAMQAQHFEMLQTLFHPAGF